MLNKLTEKIHISKWKSMKHFNNFFSCLIHMVRLLIMYLKRSENSVDTLTKETSV